MVFRQIPARAGNSRNHCLSSITVREQSRPAAARSRPEGEPMDKNEKRQFRKAARLHRLSEVLLDEPTVSPRVTSEMSPVPSPLQAAGLRISGPWKASASAQASIRQTAAQGNAGTGRPIPTLHGAPKTYATEAAIGGGTVANGGGGRAAAAGVLNRAGRSAFAGALAGHAALILAEVVMQVGPGIATALVRAEIDVRAVERAERDQRKD